MSDTTIIEDFPREIRAYFDAFYAVAGSKTPQKKIEALRAFHIKEPMMVAASEGILSDEEEVRALEYYIVETMPEKVNGRR